VRERRVLISGMGGELGSLVASLVEGQPWAGRIAGLDLDPPRRRLRRAEFHLIHPTDVERTRRLAAEFKPEILIHLGVYEPDARASASEAAEWTPTLAESVLLAAAETGHLESIVVRSGVEVYGRRCGTVAPTESDELRPTSPFGRQVHAVEEMARSIGSESGATVASMRLAPVLGPHVPSPLGRLLRLPSVPFNLFGNPSFSVIDDRDAARSIVGAAGVGYDGALNVVAAGCTTVLRAARQGSRLPLPLVGPQWWVARPMARLLGAPIPDHVQELLSFGRLADGERLRAAIGVVAAWSTTDVIDALHSWESVTYVQQLDPAA
jgi:UDP-glucose 4-epimerase